MRSDGSDQRSDRRSIRHSRLSTSTMADIATGLACSAESWTDHLEVHEDGRLSARLVATDDFDAWLIRWPKGYPGVPS